MLVGLFVSKNEQTNKNMIEMLSNKFQGTEFIALHDLSEELSMASLAKGVFDRIIVYVAAFNGLSAEEVSNELSSLRSYKEIRANNVRVTVLDKLNQDTGNGILDLAYRKMFGAFVDCEYYIKNGLSMTDLVTLLRDVNFSSDRIEKKSKTGKVNKGLVQALSREEETQPKYVDNSVELNERDRQRIAEDLRGNKSKSKPAEKRVEEKRVEEHKTKPKRFSLFGRRKDVEEQVEELTVNRVTKVEKSMGKVKQEQRPETMEPESSYEDYMYDEQEEFIEDTGKEVSGASVRRQVEEEDIQFEEREVKRENTKYKEVEPAVSRSPEIVDRNQIDFEYRDINQQRMGLNYGNSFGNERVADLGSKNEFNGQSGFNGQSFGETSLFGEMSSADDLINRQLQLKELELKARMLEAQAQIKHTEYESNARSALMRPVRGNERVTGYVSNNQGRAKIIIVTGMSNSGKTTLTKIIGEILKDHGYVIDVDLDFNNRTLSDSFSRLEESEMTRLGVFRALRDLKNIQEYVVPVDGSLDIIGTLNELSEEEENSLECRLDESLIHAMLRKISTSGVYGYVVVDCPLDVLLRNQSLLDIADDLLWCCRGSRHGISSCVRELSKQCYDDNFLSRLTIVLNGEKDQMNSWKKFFNTASMWDDDVCDKLGAIVPYIEDYEEYFYNDVTGLEFEEFKSNIMEVLRLN